MTHKAVNMRDEIEKAARADFAAGVKRAQEALAARRAERWFELRITLPVDWTEEQGETMGERLAKELAPGCIMELNEREPGIYGTCVRTWEVPQ